MRGSIGRRCAEAGNRLVSMNKGEQTRALIRDLLSLNEEERSPLSDPTSREAEERRSRRMRIGQELILHLGHTPCARRTSV